MTSREITDVKPGKRMDTFRVLSGGINSEFEIREGITEEGEVRSGESVVVVCDSMVGKKVLTIGIERSGENSGRIGIRAEDPDAIHAQFLQEAIANTLRSAQVYEASLDLESTGLPDNLLRSLSYGAQDLGHLVVAA